MNYPIVAKKVYKKWRFSAHEVWQNLRELKRNISCLVRNIDDMGSCLTRSRHLVQGLHGVEGGATGASKTERSQSAAAEPLTGRSVWGPYVSGGET